MSRHGSAASPRQRLFGLGGLVCSLLIAGCGGGGASSGGALPGVAAAGASSSTGGSSGSPSSSSTTNTASVTQVAFSISVPSQTATSSTQRQPLYVSSSTRSAKISIASSSQGSTSQTIDCTTSCATSLTAPVGSDTFNVALYDGSGGNGTVLSQGSTTVNILSGQTNTVNIAFGGIVKRVTLGMSATAFTQGTPGTAPLTVTAYDADNNIIIGSQAFAAPIVLTDTDPSGSTSLTTHILTSPASTVSIAYNGGTLGSPSISAALQDGSSIASNPISVVATTPAGASSNGATGGVNSNVRAHMMTYAVLAGNYHNTQWVDSAAKVQGDYRTLAKYVDFIQTDNRAANYAHNAGIKVGFYTDPVRPHGGETGWDKNAFARDCAGNLVIPNYPPSLEYLGNVNSPALFTGWNSEIQTHLHDQWGNYAADFVRSDDSGYQGQAWEGFFAGVMNGPKEPTGMPYCNYSDASYLSGIRNLFSQSPLPVIFNGDTDPQYNAFMENAPNVLGSQCESCFNGWNGTTWQQHVNAEIGAVALKKVFNSFTHGQLSTSEQMYTYASMLLGFDPDYVSLYTDLSTPSGFAMTPIVFIVPTQPTMTASNVSAYLQPEGVYVRQFAACYINQVSVGPCASVVNSDTRSHPFPAVLSSYHHTATISGQGIVKEFGDTGTASATGPAPAATMNAMQGLIVFP